MSPVMKGGSGVIGAVGGHLDLHSLLFGCHEEEEGHETDLQASYCSFPPPLHFSSFPLCVDALEISSLKMKLLICVFYDCYDTIQLS